ncbi:NAD(P)/FAD-dependent oxidoreductase [Streptomyces graminilatus]|uniref:NAD(P)/FAD-dependent oxidoreductase n=1 Tax=Streptomyces graminilatus TaxID=1464070 RepID=UPI0006E3F488|nr:NAD(P)/FAD-dependent oxidoreductase [Streptomyces graminilatus]
MYDVIVVGARCAGASTALLLARQGHRVLLIERARFPKDTLSTLYIHQPGVARLASWGVLERIASTGCPPVDSVTYTVGDVRLTGSSRPVDGQGAAYAPRRYLLDRILVDAAVEAGVEFRDETTAGDLLFEDGRVVGLRCRTAGSVWRDERAGLVVGADGMRSQVANQVKATVLDSAAPRTCAYYTYWDLPGARMSLHEAPGRWVGAVSTNDDATLVGCYFPQEDFQRIRGHALDAYLDCFREHAPELYEELAGSTPVDRLYGTGDQQNFVRRAAGPGWALVGDAAHHKDSITARGITDAFLQAQLLADTLADEPKRGAELDESLRRYAAAHYDLVVEGYHSTLFVAELTVKEERLAMLRAVAKSEEMTGLYFSMLSGACDSDEFFSDEFMASL